MSCTRHFLNFKWEHHTWRPHVTLAQDVPTQESNMWGRVVYGHSVRCQKEEICEACGETRHSVSCLCDTAHGEQCAIRLAWIDQSHQASR